ncbi:MAG: STAS/SEC14 domain-containing protein [Chloroflexota bacterium]
MVKLPASAGPVVGYKVVARSPADYEQLDPAVQALVDQYDDHVCVLLDLQELPAKSSGPGCPTWVVRPSLPRQSRSPRWPSVGDKRWQQWLTALVDPFYADEAEFFHPDDIDKAWAWPAPRRKRRPRREG